MHCATPRPFSVVATLSVVLGLVAACGRPAAPDPDPQAGAVAPPEIADFSRDRAWADLEGLCALGPRPAGSAAAGQARTRIRNAVAAAGLDVVEVVTNPEIDGVVAPTLTHLVATHPGASSDVFVLTAPYDSGRFSEFEFVGANDGASGAALLVELARVLATRTFPYTLRFVWIEGEGRLGRGEADQPERRWLGSETLAANWADAGKLDGIRLLVSFNRVCDADLVVTRDLGSYRWHREEFWKAARRIGRTDSFRPDRGFETFHSSHVSFRNRGVRTVVAIEDTSFGGSEVPGIYADSAEDVPAHCAPESLEAIGLVSLEALDTIGRRLAKIDRFTRVPSIDLEPAGSAPAPTLEPAPSDVAPDQAVEPPEAEGEPDVAEPAP